MNLEAFEKFCIEHNVLDEGDCEAAWQAAIDSHLATRVKVVVTDEDAERAIRAYESHLSTSWDCDAPSAQFMAMREALESFALTADRQRVAASVTVGKVPDDMDPFGSYPEGLNYADGWNACREAIIAQRGEVSEENELETGDAPCAEDDGCPTELAVLKRFWRANHQDAARYQWLCEDHDSAEAREDQWRILENFSFRSYSANSANIDAAMLAAAPSVEKGGEVRDGA